MAKTRVLVAGGLFLAWIGYLAYLVALTRDPVLLSRPQFFAANLCILARVTGDAEHPAAEVEVREVYWSSDQEDRRLEGQTIFVKRLENCGPASGWRGQGLYFLPLTKHSQADYHLTDIPSSPGFHADLQKRLRIYTASDDARRQLEVLIDTRLR